MKNIAYIDIEVSAKGRILDIGAVKWNGDRFHSSKISDFIQFIGSCEYLCGHNIISHDIKYLRPFFRKEYTLIDTLYMSPLLFPEEPYHKLLKDDKLLSDDLNNPLNDSLKAKLLFEDEITAFEALPEKLKRIYYDLLASDGHFSGFFEYIDYSSSRLSSLFRSKSDSIKEILDGLICTNADISGIARKDSIELAYAIAAIRTDDRYSMTPPWVLANYPQVENIIHILRNTPCKDQGCRYCNEYLDARKALKKWFGYDDFRKYDGEPLQESAVNAAIQGESLLAVFPTGGGKSLTFQLPALIEGSMSRSLTVVISPLQSLMKDQVENLEKKGITDAVYINGLLSPIERAETLERVRSGKANLLYIAPEQLRSKTIEKILMSRAISRFVIDEAHCFSAWGQDFRIEYMYIGEFLRELQKKKGLNRNIPVSCFTATAKPKVISDISDYFSRQNGIVLKRFTSSATRTNLRYTVLHKDSPKEKYVTLRALLEEKTCPTIVYVSRTRLAEDLAMQLCNDGFSAKAFHGQMETIVKVRNQEEFMDNNVQIMVATSAFGMGVDKSDVGLVVHYEISDSLENYIQEAGRAGRDIHSNADCYVLYNDDDLNKHFILLNQTKLTLSEINQVWKAVKMLTHSRTRIHISSLEIARKAGWEETKDIETKVKSAISALENAGFVRRGMNSPRIFATSIVPGDYETAVAQIDSWPDFTEEERINSRRIIKSLISEKRRAVAGTSEAESRIDYLSDMLGIETSKVIKAVERMRCAGILSKDNDMTAFLRKRLAPRLELFAKIESYLLTLLNDARQTFDLKEINEELILEGIAKSSVKDIRTILFFWRIQNYLSKSVPIGNDRIDITQDSPAAKLKDRQEFRIGICRFILTELATMENLSPGQEYITVNFSLARIRDSFNGNSERYLHEASLEDVQEAFLFLAKTGIISIEGGFMVLYNKLEIERIADNKLRYKKEDYQNLNEFYRQRIQQIHIVGEFANMIVRDYSKAMEYVKDYFQMDFKKFIKKYFNPSREKEISLNISPIKYNEIFGKLTPTQKRIISDKDSQYIVVPAGPGSGKTFVLVRKLASLLMMEDVKSEQLLMLTFSRAAATEFKNRLAGIIGNAAKYVEIKTFHSYAFDLLGQHGSLEKSADVVKDAVTEIREGRVETSRITKSILVIDEAQDMSDNEFALVEELMGKNEDVRVIAVGDDDQNIYTFRGSDSRHLHTLVRKYGATVYNMLENFRSATGIIECANNFVTSISGRMKSSPIIPTCPERGKAKFTMHPSDTYEEAIINEILSEKLPGTTCVLTFTNQDALILAAMLMRSGRKARLIQSNDGFSLDNLSEFRALIDCFSQNGSAIITEAAWEAAKDKLDKEYSKSRCLPILDNCISAFESEYRTKYVSDLENFIAESRIEDFSNRTNEPDDGQTENNTVIVSTIHKSKGHEYDNVYISLKGMVKFSDNERRAIYVALTRAKSNLSVHYSSCIPLSFKTSSALVSIDRTAYSTPDELMMQLSHRDVFLGFFKNRETFVRNLYSGTRLKVNEDCLSAEINGNTVNIARFSENFRKKVSELAKDGYLPYKAQVRFIVYWSYEETSDGTTVRKEIPIVLPDIMFRKQPPGLMP
ncbi:MAG: RecQ family ATP-dependent DNA helicase [Bacteroides sp.]|nr:RecQ family ATP-dependent DNA helicase [Bacteroides sp.]